MVTPSSDNNNAHAGRWASLSPDKQAKALGPASVLRSEERLRVKRSKRLTEAHEARAAARERRLGNSQTVFPPLPTGRSTRSKLDAQTGRQQRLELREGLRDVTSIQRTRDCGHKALGNVAVKQSPDGTAGFGGLSTCGSVWVCPVCAAKISAQRSTELEQVLDQAQRAGKSVAMVTLTVRHRKGQSLKETWDAVSKGWAAIISGAPWERQRESIGLVGWVKATEVTVGAKGWHVHVHAIIVCEKQTDARLLELGQWMYGRWARKTTALGFAPTRAHGVDVTIQADGVKSALGKYLAKMGGASLSKEVTLGQLKEGRLGNRAPFQVLRDFLASGDLADLDLWEEWERSSFRRRQLTWGKGLREWAKLEAEKTDEEVAAEDHHGETIVLLPRQTWREVRSTQWMVLNVLEDEGPDGLRDWLRARELEWIEPSTDDDGDDS